VFLAALMIGRTPQYLGKKIGVRDMQFAARRRARPSAGTMPNHGPLFIGFLLAVLVVVTLLQYLPALALGPIAEHFLAARGTTF
jgi:K+-transporting ATPase A subunit